MSMSRDEVRKALIDSILAVAPEADFAQLRPDRPVRGQLDIDSFDFLTILEHLHEKIGRRGSGVRLRQDDDARRLGGISGAPPRRRPGWITGAIALSFEGSPNPVGPRTYPSLSYSSRYWLC